MEKMFTVDCNHDDEHKLWSRHGKIKKKDIIYRLHYAQILIKQSEIMPCRCNHNNNRIYSHVVRVKPVSNVFL